MLLAADFEIWGNEVRRLKQLLIILLSKTSWYTLFLQIYFHNIKKTVLLQLSKIKSHYRQRLKIIEKNSVDPLRSHKTLETLTQSTVKQLPIQIIQWLGKNIKQTIYLTLWGSLILTAVLFYIHYYYYIITS